MKKIILIPLIILIIGLCIALAGFAAGGMKSFWIDRGGFHLAGTDNGRLESVDEKYSGFKDIVVEADFLNKITLKEGDAYTVRGRNYERFGGLRAELNGTTLKVTAKRSDNWITSIGIDNLLDWGAHNSDNSWLEITYPKGSRFGTVTVQTDAGQVEASGIDCEKFDVGADYGNVGVTAVRAGDLSIKADAGKVSVADAGVSGAAAIVDRFGDVELSSVRAESLSVSLDAGRLTARDVSAEVLEVEDDYGEVTLDGAEAESVSLTLSSGDLKAKGVRAGDVTVRSNFGRVSFDRLVFTGACDVKCDAGDVDLELQMSEDDVSYDLNTDAGSVVVDGRKSSGSVVNRAAGASADLRVQADFGTVRVKFKG